MEKASVSTEIERLRLNGMQDDQIGQTLWNSGYTMQEISTALQKSKAGPKGLIKSAQSQRVSYKNALFIAVTVVLTMLVIAFMQEPDLLPKLSKNNSIWVLIAVALGLPIIIFIMIAGQPTVKVDVGDEGVSIRQVIDYKSDKLLTKSEAAGGTFSFQNSGVGDAWPVGAAFIAAIFLSIILILPLSIGNSHYFIVAMIAFVAISFIATSYITRNWPYRWKVTLAGERITFEGFDKKGVKRSEKSFQLRALWEIRITVSAEDVNKAEFIFIPWEMMTVRLRMDINETLALTTLIEKAFSELDVPYTVRSERFGSTNVYKINYPKSSNAPNNR